MSKIGLSAAASSAWDHLFSPPIAHRGLWSATGAPENSLGAFDAACRDGYGIELDVQLSSDGEVVVFHDRHLARMTGSAAKLGEKTVEQLGALRLKGTREQIPTLKDVLDLIAGRTLILVEIKSRPGDEGPLDQRVADVIASYEGPIAVIGFNPYSHAWWADHRPDILRGLNSYGYDDEAAGFMPEDQRRAWRNLKQVEIAKPHFLALGAEILQDEKAEQRRAQGYPIIGWTIRSPDQAATSAPFADNIIFEGFAP